MTDRHELELQAAALIEYEARLKQYPIYYMRPNKCLGDIFESPAAIKMACGGNRSGKSHHIVAAAAAYALGFKPWVLRELGLSPPNPPWERPADLPKEAVCFNVEGIRVPVPNTILVITGLPAASGIGETLHPKFIDLLGPLIEKVWYGHKNIPSKFRLKNGSTITYGSALQTGLAHEATNFTAYFVDEPIPKRVYTGIRRGAVDQNAPIWFAFTPLGRNAPWMFVDLYRRADQKRVGVWHMSLFDNPHLTERAKREFASDPAISDVEKEARVHGRFIHLIDRIWTQFNEGVHVIDPITPNPEWLHYFVADPHTVKPWAMGWACQTPRGDVVIYKEWPAEEYTSLRRDTRSVQDYAELIRRAEGTRPADIRYLDPNYGPRTDIIRGHLVRSTSDLLADYGIHTVTQINDQLDYGEQQVRSFLAYDREQPISDLNRPRLYVCKNCTNHLNALRFYTAVNREDGDVPDEVKRDPTWKDFADLIRYLCVGISSHGGAPDRYLDQVLGEDHATFSDTLGECSLSLDEL